MWVKFSASAVASTNQFLIEDALQAAKEKKQNASNQRQIK